MHSPVPLNVLYFGTPVVLISSRNPDGTTNVAPMSSAWWLGQSAMVGMADAARTTQNMVRERECVLNLVPSSLSEAVDALALTTGADEVLPRKARMGYRHVADKFATAGLTAQPADLVRPDRVRECPVQLECRVWAAHPFGAPDLEATAFELEVLRVHVEDSLRVPGTDHIDPDVWDPLIMKFCELFGGGGSMRPSRLAEAWQIPGRRLEPVESVVPVVPVEVDESDAAA
jgi:flavin reductase (DIM6/NTAB) family NADH-FMN oxidoreductase RutF